MINIFFNIKDKIPVFFKIVQYKLFFIETWPTSFIDIEFGWRVWKKNDSIIENWGGRSDIAEVKFPQIDYFDIS